MPRFFLASEKRLLVLSFGLCALTVSGAYIFEANNRLTEPRFKPLPPLENNALDFWRNAVSLQVAPTKAKGKAADVTVDNWAGEKGDVPTPYSPEAFAQYPLARERAFLAANAVALKELRDGLEFPYQGPEVLTPQQATKAGFFYSDLHRLIVVLQVEAHARAQSGDFDGAADSLHDIERVLSAWADGGDRIGLLRLPILTKRITSELSDLLPHLSASKASQVARRLLEFDERMPSPTEALRVFERVDELELLDYCRRQDFEPLYREAMWGSNPSAMARLYWKWNNKSSLVSTQRHNFDGQFAQLRLPRLRRSNLPQYETYDELDQLLHWRYDRWLSDIFARRATFTRLLAVRSALHAYHLERGFYPRKIAELVPRFLPFVPLDAYSEGAPLRYDRTSRRWLSNQENVPVLVVNPQVYKPQAPVYTPVLPGGWPAYATRKIWSSVPYTLYSVGPDGGDDGGLAFEQSTYPSKERFTFNPYKAVKPRYDVVAGVNS